MAIEDRLYPLLSFYERSPTFLKQVTGCLYRSLPESLRLGSLYGEFQELAAGYDYSTEAIGRYQLRQVKLSLEEAYSGSPFYRARFDEIGVQPGDIKSLDQLKDLPVLEKADLQSHLKELVNQKVRSDKRLYLTTGGSTGIPTGFYLQKGISRPKEQAFLERIWSRAGYRKGDRLAVIRGHVTTDKCTGRICSYDAIRDWLMLSSYHLEVDRLDEYVNRIRSFNPDILHAYPSAALKLASLLQANGAELGVRLKAVLCGSEQLTLPQKRLLEDTFQCRVLRWYGHAERVVLAGEGRESPLFYFFPQYGYVEFGEPDENGLREVIGTSFHNMAMPLIRYRTGDYVEVVSDSTDKEFPWPAVRAIRGRGKEFLVSASGRHISLTAFNMHDGVFDGLYAVQFYQDRMGFAEFRYVPGPGFANERLAKIEAAIRRKLGDDFRVDLIQVQETEKTIRGKHRWLISRLDPDSTSPTFPHNNQC